MKDVELDELDPRFQSWMKQLKQELPKPKNLFATTRIMAAIDEQEKSRNGGWEFESFFRWAALASIGVMALLIYSNPIENKTVATDVSEIAMTLHVGPKQLALPLADEDTVSYDALTSWILEHSDEKTI